jgi:hypothetical protein
MAPPLRISSQRLYLCALLFDGCREGMPDVDKPCNALLMSFGLGAQASEFVGGFLLNAAVMREWARASIVSPFAQPLH